MDRKKILLLGLNILNGIFKFVAAGLCYAALSPIYENGIYPQEMTAVYLEMACAATSSISVLLGLEYLIFRSKKKRGIRSGLIFDVLISAILIYVLNSATKEFKEDYLGDKILGSEADLWADDVRESFKSAYHKSLAAEFVLIASIINIFALVYLNENDWK